MMAIDLKTKMNVILKYFVAAGLVIVCAGQEKSAGKDLSPGSVMLEKPRAGSRSSHPFPGFSWSEHRQFVDFYQATTDRPNILWLVIDDMGAHFSCYGEKVVETPNIDRLAHEGTRFTNAFLTAPVCSTARSAMITGMYQTTIGAHNHLSGRGKHRIVLPGKVVPVPVLFRKAGYVTSNENYPTERGAAGKADYNFDWDPAMYDGPGFPMSHDGKPFFAQLQLFGGKYRGGLLESKWLSKVAPKALGELTDPEKVELPPYYPRDPVILQDWANYLDTVRYTDSEVGEIIATLEKEDLLDKTIIILFGDNGISHARGKQFVYDEGIHMPLIIRGPGIAAGKVRDDLVEHIDLAATSLALAGAAVPGWMQGDDIFATDYQAKDTIFSARDRCGETVDMIRSVRTKRYKFIRNFFPDRPLLQPSNYKDTKDILSRSEIKEGRLSVEKADVWRRTPFHGSSISDQMNCLASGEIRFARRGGSITTGACNDVDSFRGRP